MAKKSGLGKGLDALFLDNNGDERQDGSALMVRISEIEPNKGQPRKNFDENALAELADSIREHGVIQPLLVRKLDHGGYQLVAGERRWRASRMIGLDEVPVVVKDLTETEVKELGLIENLQREDLNPLEEAAGYKELMATYGLTQEQVSKRVGKSRSAVANSLRILGLPQQVHSFLASGELTLGHAKALLGLGDEEKIVAAVKEVVSKGLSVRETEKLASKNGKEEEKKSNAKSRRENKDHFFAEMELAMNEELGRKVEICMNEADTGVLKISFFGKEDLASIAEKLAQS
ncbi:MAG: ParB/RepB/Spo0J family partition protein [Oscillospiraceae bacterium]